VTEPVSRRVNAERVSLFGWSRAILLQLAHPLVAAGVAEHSTFREGRLTAVRRLHHTVGAMLSLTFGSNADRETTLDSINAIHRRVKGTLRESTGPVAAGTRYSAEDPALLLWVHATLLESIPLVYERLVAPLSDADRDRYCLEAEPVVQALGAREGAPRSWADLRSYLDRMYSSGEIVVGKEARALAAAVLRPPFAPLVAPAARVNWLLTVGLLPPSIRAQYGFTWTPSDERALERWTVIIRGIRRWLPDAVALWPESR
jgi:uncharacterized protein (DUF2236 family)